MKKSPSHKFPVSIVAGRATGKNKYNAKPVEIDGHRFPSKLEGMRYVHLKLLERAGEIKDLELQPKFLLIVNGKLICTYYADFRYFDVKKSETIIEDAKGFVTPVFRLKIKLLAALMPDVHVTCVNDGR